MADIIILAIALLIVGLSIYKVIDNKRKGKTGCNGCKGCSQASTCDK